MWAHDARDLGDGRHDHAVAELAVSLRVRHRDAQLVRVAHKPGAFTRRQTAGPFIALGDEDFAAVLVITGG